MKLAALVISSILPWLGHNDTLAISIVGDVMLHTRQIEYARGNARNEFDFHPFLDSLERDFKSDDITIANMEFSLGGKPYTGYPAFSAPDSYAVYAAQKGIDVFLTANNHIMDRGPEGLKRTRGLYRRMSDPADSTYQDARIMAYTQDNPTYVIAKGIKVAIINCTYGCNAALSPGNEEWEIVPINRDREKIRAAIEKARTDSADIVIALPHWGEEYVLKHNSAQRSFAEFLVECGVDAIVGAHPHVVQDFELIDGVPVYYSLGNAVSDMSAVNTQLELMVKLKFTRTAGIPSGEGAKVVLCGCSHEFLWCSRPGFFCKGYCVLKLADMLGRRDMWLNPYEYDKMVSTYNRIKY